MANKVEKSETEWRTELTPEQYHVLREKGTERPGTGEYEHTKDPGEYRCAGCGKVLFRSDEKFDSRSGWPSFWAPADEEAVETETDIELRHGPHGGEVQRLWRTPGPRLRGRPEPDGAALLHQLRWR